MVKKFLDALYEAGAGQIGDYKNCSFRVEGTGTFRPTGGANPFIGTVDQDEEVKEFRIEVILQAHQEYMILSALKKRILMKRLLIICLT
jgi:hypothetical protein